MLFHIRYLQDIVHKMYKAEDMEIPDFSFAEHEKNPPYFKEVFKKVPKLAEYKESGQGVHGLHRHITSD